MYIDSAEELTFQGDNKKGFVCNHAMYKDHFLREKVIERNDNHFVSRRHPKREKTKQKKKLAI